MSRGVNEVNTESHRNAGLSNVSLWRTRELARHPLRWLLISLRSINRHRAPVPLVGAAWARSVVARLATTSCFARGSATRNDKRRRSHLLRLRSAPPSSNHCERSSFSRSPPRRRP